MDSIDCKYTDELVCPWCGYEDVDSWEFSSDFGETECGSCGKAFEYERHVSVTYSTSKVVE